MNNFKLIALLIFITIFFKSCSVFKNTSKDKQIEKEEIKKDVVVKKEKIDSVSTKQTGKSDSFSANFTEEIIYKKPILSNTDPIEITGTFKMDTSAIMKGDTVVKLLDVENKDVSITVLQDKKTGELRAKVKTNIINRTVPFEELTIKRDYKSNSSSADTTKESTVLSKSQQDSTDKSESDKYVKSKQVESKPSFWGSLYLWGGVVAIIFIIYLILAYKGILPNIFKKKNV